MIIKILLTSKRCTQNKLKIINSIVNTLTNLKEINSIKFLINGETNEKFADIYIKNNN